VTQLGQLRDAYSQFQAAGAEIYCAVEVHSLEELAISTDDAATGQSLEAEQNIPYPLLPDPTKAIINQYTGVKPAGIGAGMANVAVFVVDKNGQIAYGCAGRPPVNEILAEVQKLP